MLVDEELAVDEYDDLVVDRADIPLLPVIDLSFIVLTHFKVIDNNQMAQLRQRQPVPFPIIDATIPFIRLSRFSPTSCLVNQSVNIVVYGEGILPISFQLLLTHSRSE